VQLRNPHRIDAIGHTGSHQADLTHQLQGIQRSPQQGDQLIDLLEVESVGAINAQSGPTAAQAATEQGLKPSEIIGFLSVKREHSPQQPLASHLNSGLTDLNVNRMGCGLPHFLQWFQDSAKDLP
jgi:hypothetical protein